MATKPQVINLAKKGQLIESHWSPAIVAALNDYDVKLVKLLGEFTWHAHADTDELFFVLKGHLRIELRDDVLKLDPGELVVIPRNVEHRPVATDECQVLLIEPAGTVNTGDNPGALTCDPARI